MFLFCFLVIVLGCKKNKMKDYFIVFIFFDLMIDMIFFIYFDLNNVGGWCYVNGGIKGIVVYY